MHGDAPSLGFKFGQLEWLTGWKLASWWTAYLGTLHQLTGELLATWSCLCILEPLPPSQLVLFETFIESVCSK